MKTDANKFLRLLPVIFVAAIFAVIWILPIYQLRHDWNVRHQRLLDFQAAIRQILQSNPKFEYVYCGQYTGGKSGCVGGFVDSTNDLEKIREIYSMTLSNHSARVDFLVKIDEHIFN
jgi:hypothetical protein